MTCNWCESDRDIFVSDTIIPRNYGYRIYWGICSIPYLL